MDELRAWMGEGNAEGVTISAGSTSNTRGLLTTRAASAGQVLVTVPWSRVVSARSAAAALRREERAGAGLLPLGVDHLLDVFLPGLACSGLHAFTLLASLQLLCMLRDPANPGQPYIQLLPAPAGTRIASCTRGPDATDLLLWGEEELAELQDDRLAGDVKQDRAWLAGVYRKLFEEPLTRRPSVAEEASSSDGASAPTSSVPAPAGGSPSGGRRARCVHAGCPRSTSTAAAAAAPADDAAAAGATAGGGDTRGKTRAATMQGAPASPPAGAPSPEEVCLRQPSTCIFFCRWHAAPTVSLESFLVATFLVRSRSMELSTGAGPGAEWVRNIIGGIAIGGNIIGGGAAPMPDQTPGAASCAGGTSGPDHGGGGDDGSGGGGGGGGNGGDGGAVRVILPVIDMLNTAGAPDWEGDCCRLRATRHGVELVAGKDLVQGEELLLDYGRKSSRELLRTYGFVQAVAPDWSSSSSSSSSTSTATATSMTAPSTALVIGGDFPEVGWPGERLQVHLRGGGPGRPAPSGSDSDRGDVDSESSHGCFGLSIGSILRLQAVEVEVMTPSKLPPVPIAPPVANDGDDADVDEAVQVEVVTPWPPVPMAPRATDDGDDVDVVDAGTARGPGGGRQHRDGGGGWEDCGDSGGGGGGGGSDGDDDSGNNGGLTTPRPMAGGGGVRITYVVSQGGLAEVGGWRPGQQLPSGTATLGGHLPPGPEGVPPPWGGSAGGHLWHTPPCHVSRPGTHSTWQAYSVSGSAPGGPGVCRGVPGSPLSAPSSLEESWLLPRRCSSSAYAESNPGSGSLHEAAWSRALVGKAAEALVGKPTSLAEDEMLLIGLLQPRLAEPEPEPEGVQNRGPCGRPGPGPGPGPGSGAGTGPGPAAPGANCDDDESVVSAAAAPGPAGSAERLIMALRYRMARKRTLARCVEDLGMAGWLLCPGS